MSRTVTWIVFSSAGILFMPVMIETERLQIQDQQKAQKNQMLFGTGIEKILKKNSWPNVYVMVCSSNFLLHI